MSGSKAPHADLNDPIQSGIYGQAQDLVKGYFSPQFDRIESLYKLKIVMRWLATVCTGIVVVRSSRT